MSPHPMKVVITGGAGFLGRRLARRILEKGTLAGVDGTERRVERLVLFDMVPAEGFHDRRVESIAGDISHRADVLAAIGDDTSSIFHLAAIVSAEAEADYDLGMRINLEGTRHVIDAARRLHTPPRVVFASSIAVYGGAGLPATVTDETPVTPQTSYGAAKACGEQLISDASRKGFLDGRALRLPTITVRTGRPNRAASTWASSMVREPLCGDGVTVPVAPGSTIVVMSPRRVIDAFIAAHEADASAFGDWRAMLLPGLAVTAEEIAQAVERNRGNRQLGAIHFAPDTATQRIVDGWPRATQAQRAKTLGIEADGSIDDIVRQFIEDDLDNQMRGIF